MAGIDGFLGIGLGLWAIAGVILVLLGFYGQSVGIAAEKPRKALKLLGALVLIGCLLTYYGIFEAQSTSVSDDDAVYEIGVSESLSHVTYDSNGYKFTMALSFNDTSGAFVDQTQYLQANFTITRADTGLTDAVTTGNLGTVGIVDVAGASNERILDQNADDTYKVKWTKSGGISTWEDCTVLVEAGGDNWVVMNITLNADAVAAMDTYESSTITFTLAGYDFEIVAMKATVTT